MRFSVIAGVAALTTLLPSLAGAVSSTDEYQDADTAQSGYMPNHNIDPAALSLYGHAWTYTCNTGESFSAKPLTYTPNGYYHELVIIASQQNIIRVIDSLSGKLLFSRTLDPPFQASDSSCGDISPTIGITGTPIIDPNTDIMYFFSKGYKNAATGPVNTLAGQYKFYAVQLPALTNIPGYPIIMDGHFADNDHTRYFVGGTLLQRPGLAMIGSSIVAGFGGHCDNFNYTGMLVSVDKSAATINSIQAMVASPGGPAEQDNYLKQSGGKAGIWQGGMGLAVNGNNVYFVTGNGVGAGVNKGKTPYSGKTYSSTLEQVVARFGVDPNTGILTQADWFEPYNFDTQLDGGDRDMASAGVALLDRNTFNAPSAGVNGIAVASGKDGIVYIMDADNLGGFYNGAGTPPDATLQQIPIAGGSFYGGVGSSPIDGGYLYFCPTGGPLYAYSYGLDGNGKPLFTLAGQIQTTTHLACNSNPTVTSLNGQSGSGVVWLSDVNAGLVAFNAVPVNGVLVQIPLGWSSGRLTKYQRPAFGNRTVYTIETNMLYAMAPPAGSGTTTSKAASSTTATATSSSSKISTSSSFSSFTVQSSISSTVSSLSSSSTSQLSSSSTSSSNTLPGSSSTSQLSSSSTSSSNTLPGSSSTSQLSSSSTSSSNTLPGSSSTSQLSSVSTSTTSSPLASTSSSNVVSSSSQSLAASTSTSPVTSSSTNSLASASSTASISSSQTPSQTLNPLEPTTVTNFNYIGCYVDIPDGNTRSLASATFVYDPMTLESCAANCTNYDYFGTEYGRECYCGYTLSPSVRATEIDCNVPCSGNLSEICGSGARLSVYQNQIYIPPPPMPSHEAQSGNYSWQGCTMETTSGPRALADYAYYNDTMTVEACVNACSGYTYAGLEYGRECYCGNTINAGPGYGPAPTSDCSFLCPGNSLEYCGAAARLDLYQNTGPLIISSSSSSSILSSTTSSSVTTSSSSSQFSTSSTVTFSSSSSTALSSTTLVTSTTSRASVFSACSTVRATATTSAKATATSNPKAVTRTFNWNVGWVNAAPDGYTRAFVGINGQWPCPAINANIGDTIKINIVNNLGNQTTSLHFHGLHQSGTTFEDGAAMVSQCPIAPGETFVYQFTLTQSGTYWYHAHVGGQYLDGFRGPVIIRDNTVLANYGRIDGEYTLSLSDVYHVEAPYLINYYLSPNNYNGAEPVPDSALINEGQNSKFSIAPGKTYMFHVVNMGALAGQFLQFDQHEMTIIEADGVYTQPFQVSQLFVAVAQRYTVLITAKPSNCQNFAIVSQFLTDMFDSSVTPAGQQATCTAYLVYNSAAPLPVPFTLSVQPWDDTQLIPWDQQPMWDSTNVNSVYLTVDFETNDWGSTRAMVNGLTYIPQKVPTFFTALTAPPAYQMNPQIYGQVNAQVLQYGQVVEIDLNNHDNRAHPFHLHGHQFQIINRAGNEPQWPGLYSTPAAPMRRDVVVVYPGVGVTLRFIANNPGVWLFHCHTEFHVEAGMTATFIEAPDVMVAGKPYIPTSHKSVCDAQSIPRKGNAGGNSKNWLDLSNANTDSSQTYFGALIYSPAVNPYTGPSN